MANYVQTTFFTPKDTLPPNNPAKTIFGAAYDVEFGNISTSIATKPDNTTTASFTALVVGTPTGGLGATGNINAQSISINGVPVLTVAGAVTSITGTANQIATSAAVGAVTLSLPQNVIIPTPASGVSLTVNGVSGSFGLNVTGQAGTFTGLQINQSGQTGVAFYNPASTSSAVIQTGGGDRLTISSAGNLVVASPSSGTPFTVNGLANQNTVVILAPNIAGQSFGYTANAGTNTLDYCMFLASASGTALLKLLGDGSLTLGTPTGGGQGLGTLNTTGLFINGVALGTVTTGSFTAGTTGLSGATIAANWTKVGNSVTLNLAKPSTIVSNATTFTVTGLPAAIQPTTAKYVSCNSQVLNNSAIQPGMSCEISGSTLIFNLLGGGSAWTAAGTKSYGDGIVGAVFVWDVT